VFSFGLGIILSTIALKFRDAAHSIAFVFNFMIWLTPVFFPLSIIPNEYRNWLLICNPLASIIEGLRGALFFHQAIKMQSFVLFILASFLLFLSFYYFVKFEKKIIENL
jgi:ABC-type polysaccharide/polyol phosphate export permease